MMEALNALDNIYSLEILFAGKCNLQCSYCVMHKNKEKMLEYDENIRKSVLTGQFQNKIIEKFENSKEKLNTISLWGAEPTLNADLAETLLFPILDYFPHVKEIMFSTNAIIGFEKGIKPYFDCLNYYTKINKRNITLRVQYSIDGPDYITDNNRGYKGATKKVIQALKDTASYAKENINNYLELMMTTKPTVSPENQKYLLKNNKVFEWYKFFDDLTDEIVNLSGKKENIVLFIAQEPTLCTPYDYTNTEGKIYADFIKAIKNIDDTKLKYYSHPLIIRYKMFTKQCLGFQDFFGTSLSCNAGNTSMSIDYEGNIMTCHRVYDGWRSGGANYEEPAKSTQLIYNEKDFNRISYLQKAYFSNHRFRMKLLDGLLVAMVSSGEIDSKYLDIRYRRLLFILMGGATCYAGECGFQTNGLYLIPMSKIRLLCNGALEEIIDYYER